MPAHLDETDFLENWSQEIKQTDVQYNKAISALQPLISFDNILPNDVADIKCDIDACVTAYKRSLELTPTKQKLQQEQARLSQEIEYYNKKIKVLEETLETCKDKCLQASSQNRASKKLFKTAIDKYEKNLDFVIMVENKTDTSYEATFTFKSKRKKVLKVLIDRSQAKIIDCTILHDLPNDVDTSDILNLLYLLHKSLTKE
nr:unnamed protein product [Callosobruchus analis]